MRSSPQPICRPSSRYIPLEWSMMMMILLVMTPFDLDSFPCLSHVRYSDKESMSFSRKECNDRNHFRRDPETIASGWFQWS